LFLIIKRLRSSRNSLYGTSFFSKESFTTFFWDWPSKNIWSFLHNLSFLCFFIVNYSLFQISLQ
jgi:hypothetical protein